MYAAAERDRTHLRFGQTKDCSTRRNDDVAGEGYFEAIAKTYAIHRRDYRLEEIESLYQPGVAVFGVSADTGLAMGFYFQVAARTEREVAAVRYHANKLLRIRTELIESSLWFMMHCPIDRVHRLRVIKRNSSHAPRDLHFDEFIGHRLLHRSL